jgi:hypothetical protein
MNTFTIDALNQLLAPHQAPCISIYMPTARGGAGVLEDPRRFKDLVDKAEAQLRQGYGPSIINPLLERLRNDFNAERGEVWQHQLDGLAVFASPDYFSAVRLQRKMPEYVEVADSFHVKPLIRFLQTAGRYHVLCLTRKDVRLLEGNRDALDEIELVGLAGKTIYDAFGEEVNPPHASNAQGESKRAPDRPRESTPEEGVPHLDRWLRMVDRVIWDNHSKVSGLPLILCALPENQSAFRAISKNQSLVVTGVNVDPNHVPLERIRQEAWSIVEPYYHDRTKGLIDQFHVAKNWKAAGEDVKDVAEAAFQGRIATLLVDATKQVGGKLDPQTGAAELGELARPDVDDLIDDTAETVLKMGGQVMVIPPELMPTDTGVAAIYRY